MYLFFAEKRLSAEESLSLIRKGRGLFFETESPQPPPMTFPSGEGGLPKARRMKALGPLDHSCSSGRMISRRTFIKKKVLMAQLMSSAMGKAHHTAPSTPVLLSSQAAGMSTTS